MDSWLASFAGLGNTGLMHAVVLGTWFGVIHAFDPDHVATIGGLAAGNRSLTPMGYALRWALGHAAALGVVALIVLGIGASGFVEWTSYAEILVCAALFVIGGNALRVFIHRVRSRHVEIVPAHSHAGPHVHFLAPFHSHTRSGGAGVALGVLHGSAGSAAVLALLPLASFDTGLESAVYLACFSVGVLAGALAFARVFALLSVRSAAAGERLAAAFQGLIGALAIAAGIWLLFEIAHGGG